MTPEVSAVWTPGIVEFVDGWAPTRRPPLPGTLTWKNRSSEAFRTHSAPAGATTRATGSVATSEPRARIPAATSTASGSTRPRRTTTIGS